MSYLPPVVPHGKISTESRCLCISLVPWDIEIKPTSSCFESRWIWNFPLTFVSNVHGEHNRRCFMNDISASESGRQTYDFLIYVGKLSPGTECFRLTDLNEFRCLLIGCNHLQRYDIKWFFSGKSIRILLFEPWLELPRNQEINTNPKLVVTGLEYVDFMLWIFLTVQDESSLLVTQTST